MGNKCSNWSWINPFTPRPANYDVIICRFNFLEIFERNPMHDATTLEKVPFISHDLCDFSALGRSVRVNKLKSIHCPLTE